MEIKRIALEDLAPDKKNARKHGQKNIEAIRGSLKRFGQVEPLVVQKSTGKVVGGNGRVEAMRLLGMDSADVVEVDVSDAEATAMGIALNRTAELAEWDVETLLELSSDVDLSDVGFDASDLNGFGDGAGTTEVAEDDVPDPPALPITKPGDLWLMGDHRLLCGDSTEMSCVQRVMGEARADLMWTDPPYGVSYVGKTKNALTIENDGADDLPALLAKAFSCADAVLRDGAAIYIAHPAGALCVAFGSAFIAQGWHFHQTLTWVKDSMVLGHSDYHFMHEPIIYGWRGKNRSWFGDRNKVSVLSHPKPSRNESHPTMKPVGLVAECMTNSTKPGDICFEPFAGSGTTFAAAEQLGRAVRGIELSPVYCDVIVTRWERLTGKKATHG